MEEGRNGLVDVLFLRAHAVSNGFCGFDDKGCDITEGPEPPLENPVPMLLFAMF